MTMTTSSLGTKGKHQQCDTIKKNSLGVLEFISALNGDDPNQILHKLHRFVRVVSFERNLALSPLNDESKNDDGSIDGQINDRENKNDDEDKFLASILSFDDDQDSNPLIPKSKRQKPDWQTDKNNYLVPFVGTSVAKGQTGSVVPHSQIWPSGFLEVYLKHSPMGVELLKNNFVGAIPPLGVHKIILGNRENEIEFGDHKKRKKTDGPDCDGGQSRGQIVSIALQTNYWMALAEWMSGFISNEKLQKEIFWDSPEVGRRYPESSSTGESSNNNKCAISPEIMTILMKSRLPEWLDAIQKYEKMQKEHTPRQQRDRRRQTHKHQKLQNLQNRETENGGQHQKQLDQQMQEEEAQKQLRKEITYRKWQSRQDRLLVSAVRNLTCLCHLSNGTAREVLRKLAARSDTGSCDVGNGEKIVHDKGVNGTTDGASWMIQIFEHQFSNKNLEEKFNAMLPLQNHDLQTECLRFVCTLLETRDTTILSRITEVPTWFVKREGPGKNSKGFRPNVGSTFGGGTVGAIYIALRFGTQRLIGICEGNVQNQIGSLRFGRNKAGNKESSVMYARSMVRFIRGIRDILLPSSVCGDSNDRDRNRRAKKAFHTGDPEFPIAPSLLVNLLTGEILNNLATLSRLCPIIDTETNPINDVIERKFNAEDLVDPMKSACIEARRLLFILLADAKSSPFLHHLQRLKTLDPNRCIEQAGLFLPQLGMTLHLMMIGQGCNLPMRKFLNICLNTTPELVPHFFKTLQLNEPKPNYRTIAALSFIEGILRDAPPLKHSTLLRKKISDGTMSKWTLSSIIPPCVTKLILGKLVQSPSALLVTSGLKLLATILRRTHDCTLAWAVASLPGHHDAGNRLFQEVLHHLPDVLLLLSISSRFDPYTSKDCDASSHANAIVMIHLCETLKCIVDLDPVSVVNVKFDWVKFLPNGPTRSSTIDGTTMPGFHNVEPLLQIRILQTLLVISKLCNISFSAKMLPSVLTVLVSTDIPEVYSIARDLALSLMEMELFRDTSSASIDMNIDGRSYQGYESSLWVDGITPVSIEYLVTWLAEYRQLKVQKKIMFAQAWSKASMSDEVQTISVSTLLLFTVCHIIQERASKSDIFDEFSTLVIRVATEMLLYQTDPRPFAAILVFNAHEKIPTDEHTARLIKLAKVVLCRNNLGANDHLLSSSSGIFGEHFNRLQVLSQLKNCLSISHLRHCLSLLKFSGDQYDENCEILLKITSQLLMTKVDVPDMISRLGVALRGQDIVPSDRECILAHLLTFMGSTRLLLDCLRILQTSIFGLELNECSLSTLGTRVIYALMLPAFVPCDLSDGTLSDLWKYCIFFMKSKKKQPAHHLENFLLRVILKTTPDISAQTKRFPLVEIFELWVILSEKMSTQLVSELTFRLEETLSSSFARNDDGWGTWNVYKKICDISPEAFSKFCLNTLVKKNMHYIDSGPAFVNGKHLLSEVIKYDCSKFSFLPDMLINAERNSMMKSILAFGFLDHVAATYVVQVYSQKNAESTKSTSVFANAAESIGKRLLSRLLAHIEEGNALIGDLVLEAIETLCFNKLMLLETSNKLKELLDHLENSNKIMSIDRERRIFDLTCCVISPLLSSEIYDASMLLTKAFLRICAVFPKCLKKMKRHHTVEYSTTRLMHSFSLIVQKSDYFDKSMIAKLSTSVDNCVVLCLKYGMLDPNCVTSSSFLGGCLKMVRLILSQSGARSSSKHQISLGNISPAQVHAMIVSHSSYRSALVGRNSLTKKEVDALAGSKFCQGLTQRTEMLLLMICCASRDAEITTTSNEAWDTLLSVYNASTSPSDRLIRHLLFLYEKHSLCSVQLNDLRWGRTKVEDSSDDVGRTSHNWDWLVDSIDLGRVRSTLSQFPVLDTLKPVTLIGIDSNGKSADESIHSSLDNDDDYGNQSDNGSGDDDQSTRSNEIRHANKWPTNNKDVEEWRGQGEDPRYSPGFILPLILATMETFLPMSLTSNDERTKYMNELSESDKSHTAKNEAENVQRRAFGQICRRLYGNGAISLAVASLSSQCPALRKVALSICCLFLESLQMHESASLKVWRERPQLEMIMSSIQRGLSVRRSIRMKRFHGSSGLVALRDDGEVGFNLVPAIPAFSAVFLAKALLILSRPADDMYGQMNRYFLRLDDFHGAFQDFFGLPGFLSLYCSSADGLMRCKAERNWALQSLIDGTVDEFSFRIIARHHVPELIMSSVGSYIDLPGNKGEMSIAIDALKALLQCGGPSAASHMVKRQGLLSWLHGIANWRRVSTLFPFDDIRCKFLCLMVAAIKCHRSHMYTQDNDRECHSFASFHEGVPLSDVVIRIFLDSKSDENADPNELYELTCDALWEVYLTTPQKRMGNICAECSGMTKLDEMTSVLEKFAVHKHMCPKVLAALCALPLAPSVARSNNSAKTFCDIALGVVLSEHTTPSLDMVAICLRRILELVQNYGVLASDPHFSSQFAKTRILAVNLEEGVAVWNEIFKCLQID